MIPRPLRVAITTTSLLAGLLVGAAAPTVACHGEPGGGCNWDCNVDPSLFGMHFLCLTNGDDEVCAKTIVDKIVFGTVAALTGASFGHCAPAFAAQ